MARDLQHACPEPLRQEGGNGDLCDLIRNLQRAQSYCAPAGQVRGLEVE